MRSIGERGQRGRRRRGARARERSSARQPWSEHFFGNRGERVSVGRQERERGGGGKGGREVGPPRRSSGRERVETGLSTEAGQSDGGSQWKHEAGRVGEKIRKWRICLQGCSRRVHKEKRRKKKDYIGEQSESIMTKRDWIEGGGRHQKPKKKSEQTQRRRMRHHPARNNTTK